MDGLGKENANWNKILDYFLKYRYKPIARKITPIGLSNNIAAIAKSETFPLAA